MSELSDRVYKILMENAQQPVEKRGIEGITGGSLNLDEIYVEEEPYTYETPFKGDKTVNQRNRRVNKVPSEKITHYNIDNLVSENITNKKGGNCCPSCGGALVGGALYNKKGGALYNKKGGALYKETKTKVKKTVNEGLQHYNMVLNKIKSKGYTHKQAQEIMRQIKEEFGAEYEGGNFWKGFARGFKKGFLGTAKTLLPLAPLLL